MTLIIDQKITVDEFERLLARPENAHRLLELIDGEIAEKMPTQEHGAQIVWLVYPSKRIVEVFYADGEIDIFREGEVLSGEEVLPGFTLPVADIFNDPFAAE